LSETEEEKRPFFTKMSANTGWDNPQIPLGY